jgi:hypothetical protein
MFELFLEKIIPKDKKLFLGIKSGAEGSKITLFWGGFKSICSIKDDVFLPMECITSLCFIRMVNHLRHLRSFYL